MVRPDFSTDALTGVWRELADDFLRSPEGRATVERVLACECDVFPPRPFRAMERTPFESVRAVIFGQDPYHTPGKACGLAFSVPPHEKLPPSLRNIFKVAAEPGEAPRTRGDLGDWADAGVLLLNTILTVEVSRPLAHAGWGWETMTREAVRRLSAEREGLVFFLWGKPAQTLRPLIDEMRHKVLASSHPSPLSASRGEDAFLKSDCFRKANEWLVSRGGAPIDWNGRSGEPTLF